MNNKDKAVTAFWQSVQRNAQANGILKEFQAAQAPKLKAPKFTPAMLAFLDTLTN